MFLGPRIFTIFENFFRRLLSNQTWGSMTGLLLRHHIKVVLLVSSHQHRKQAPIRGDAVQLPVTLLTWGVFNDLVLLRHLHVIVNWQHAPLGTFRPRFFL